MDKSQRLHNLRHSAAHLLAQAILELYPTTLLTIGPATEEGFFYDVLPAKNFKEEDIAKIEERMHGLARKNYKIEGGQVPKNEARKLFVHNRFKLELIDGIPGETVGIYHQGPFFDLCKGGHVDSIGDIKFFKLMGISGSYWRADRNGQPLQRISGVAFETKEEMDAYFKRLEEAKNNDHRSLGKQLDLFSFHEEAPGAPFFHAKGLAIFNELINFSRQMQKNDYSEVKTPIILNESLWHRSGHYEHYKNNMFFTQTENVNYCIRPMNCPGAALLFKEKPRSYRELPLRLSEYGLVHRCELSGVLHGLLRVRAFTQDDAHIFCSLDQVESEVSNVLELADKIYSKFGFSKIVYALSTRPESFSGTEEMWQKAEAALHSSMKARGLAYKIQEGEGAFYGPKIEIKIEDTMGREWQCGTVQLDFNMPINFGLEYIKSDQEKATPVMVHRAIFGSIERFLGILLEHYKGHFPFWIAPVQIRILKITDAQQNYANTILEALQEANIRVELDHSSDQISAQIRRAQMDKIPWMVVLGKKEQEQNTITLRYVNGQQEFGISLEELLQKAKKSLF